ncbi:3-oxoacyl-[acyl-carrier-protein] synthase III C-terminal domain-containing protein [Tamlana flava]|uniref:3-oxoacyl-[acyl-carrier-protein] synthase III C-terminal domain-containing protein n=1 Tax=Tamlana flava TaxID=3158572 RepID=UPI00351B35C6
MNTVIESLGVYYPQRSCSTEDVLNGCETPIRFPLEKITGIKSRGMAGTEEFSIHLSINAVKECLSRSKYSPKDIDLLICCNISRVDGPGHLTFEPSTSVRLRNHFGFENAMVFDIANACAGMFTGIYLVDNLIKSGAIARGIVVSGEYITHLTLTAQKEIENFMDSKMACLTLGDAGAAVLLEEGDNNDVGFQAMQFHTFGRYSPYCIAKEAKSGGWIMLTDSVNLTEAGIKTGIAFAISTLEKADWSAAECDHLIMHQTSKMTLDSAKKEINKILNGDYFHDGNTVINLKNRGNTASTSHFVALADRLSSGSVEKGDKVVFSITASGLTVGAALYTFDDLPNKFINKPEEKSSFQRLIDNKVSDPVPLGMVVESIGIADKEANVKDTLDLLQTAALKCLNNSNLKGNDIELLIFCGVYRSEYLLEPAMAALLAGKLEMNASSYQNEDKSTFAFDIFNGTVGFMNALFMVQNFFLSGQYKTAMIVASEIENNAVNFPDTQIGLRETASAIILKNSSQIKKGFSKFHFEYFTDAINTYTSYAKPSPVDLFLKITKSLHLEDIYQEAILKSVDKLLAKSGLVIDEFDIIIPPQFCSKFIERLRTKLNVPREKMFDIAEGVDLFTSTIPFALKEVNTKDGDLGLIITVGSGIQVGCAIYHF